MIFNYLSDMHTITDKIDVRLENVTSILHSKSHLQVKIQI
jgi:hypothetical protein